MTLRAILPNLLPAILTLYYNSFHNRRGCPLKGFLVSAHILSCSPPLLPLVQTPAPTRPKNFRPPLIGYTTYPDTLT